MTRVLIADDSNTARVLLRTILDHEGGFEVVAEAASGEEALQYTVEHSPDVIIMDVVMPGIGGFEATRRIMQKQPTPIVIVTSSFDVEEVGISMEALRSGAVLSLPKPDGPAVPGFAMRASRFRRMVRLMSEVRVARLRPPKNVEAEVKNRPARRPRLVAIASSTGGPGALHTALKPLPADFPLPILIAQHIAEGFANGLARWLNAELAIGVRVAVDGERPEAGVAYVAPDGGHLGFRNGHIHVSNHDPDKGFRPSADFLFEQTAAACGDGLVAIILTGMGNDGKLGLRSVHRRGGWIIAQDEASSVVWSMPKGPIDDGIADEVLHVEAVGPTLMALVS